MLDAIARRVAAITSQHRSLLFKVLSLIGIMIAGGDYTEYVVIRGSFRYTLISFAQFSNYDIVETACHELN